MHPVLLLACCATSLTADPASSLYTRSLTACVEAREKQGQKDDPIIVLKNVIVDNPKFMYPLPVKVGSVKVEYMDASALVKRFRDVGSPFPAIEILPIMNHGQLLTVSCREYSIRVENRAVVHWLRGGTTIRWQFDPCVGDYVRKGADRSGLRM